MAVVRTWLRVTPGASRPGVGGEYPRPGEPALRVRVRERAVDGRASRAALALVAEALDIPPGSIRLDVGARSRDKLVSIEVENTAEVTARLQTLRSKST